MLGENVQFLDRIQVLGRRLLNFGPYGVLRRVSRKFAQRAGERLGWDEFDFPLRPEDIQSPEAARVAEPKTSVEGKLHVAWVCAPPGPGSGGHTTLFRMVQAMESRGHECTLLLYERDSDDVDRHEGLIRANWPELAARVASATTSTDEFDAVVASSWVTAHVVAHRFSKSVQRFYFIQDYEPYFYPRGYLYTLAEMTYRFGFSNIALGRMVANELREKSGIQPDVVVPFGCDRGSYQIIPRFQDTGQRKGVVYYAKKSADRRGYALARATLERFHELRPDQEIHIVGDKVQKWKVPVINHGSLRPAELNVLYNKTIAGLAMSFTNVSLVPGELLAAGNIPVLNDDPDVRLDMPSEEAIWGAPHPDALARKLAEVVDRADVDRHAADAATSAPRSWEFAQAAVATFVEGLVCGASGHNHDEPLSPEALS